MLSFAFAVRTFTGETTMPEAASSPPHLAAGVPAGPGDLLLDRRLRIAAPMLPGRGSLLDLGCGNGAQTLRFSGRCDRLIGVDINADYLAAFAAAAARLDPSPEVQPLPYDGSAIPLPDGAVDAAVCFAVLEHVRDEALTLSELARVLRPGGSLVLSVPNRWWIFETHGADLPLLPWNRVPLVSWWPKRLHDRWARARIYTRREIEEKIAATGLEIERSDYLTAPMDVLRWRPLQRLLRRSLFRGDTTRLPVLAVEVVVAARKPL